MEFGVNFFSLVETVTGQRPIGGAAINSITESFLAFSWLGIGVSGYFGYLSGRVTAAARRDPGLVNVGLLIACLVATVYWGAQSSTSVFFQWFFTVLPIFALIKIVRWLQPRRSPALMMRPMQSAVSGTRLSTHSGQIPNGPRPTR